MNEKIEELKKLCIEQRPCFEFHISTCTLVPKLFKGQQVYTDELNLEKFANLIIQECIDSCNINPIYGTLMAEERIKQHFGLEQ